MAAKITQLINKQDSFEIIRDQIAAILEIEKENQKVLAGPSADDYDFKVYIEKFHPWELLIDSNGDLIGDTKLANVFFDTTSQNSSQTSQASQTHVYDGIINIDCYGAKITEEISEGTHNAGDELTARESQRVARLARNILAYNEYYPKLALSGIVNNFTIKQLNSLQPNIQDRPSSNIMVTRIMLQINYNEFNFATVPATLGLLTSKCTRAEDGSLYFQTDFDYT